MKKPRTLIKNPYISEQEIEKFKEFLMIWATYYTNETIGNWASVIKEILGYDDKEFSEILNHYNLRYDVLEYLKNVNKGGNRPLTSQEIAYHFSGLLEPRTVYKQLESLEKYKLIKITKIKLNSRYIKLYSYNPRSV